MTYLASDDRYETMHYNRCGRSGLKLPALSLGLWHNFGGVDTRENAREMLVGAFDLGVTHFDLANNYGPPPGSAEETFGSVLQQDLKPYRDELVISTKAGFTMWPGPYGNWGSRKYLLSSLDQSLQRMGLDYVDIFYHHRPDDDTPLEETMGALDAAVRSGKALYVGISNYPAERTAEAANILQELGTPALIHQQNYSMFNRGAEQGLFKILEDKGMGCIAFCPLAQGLLTDKYLNDVPEESRAAREGTFLREDSITPEYQRKVKALNELAQERGQSLAQMALAWVLRNNVVASALIGASRLEQIKQNIDLLQKPDFSDDELSRIDWILTDGE